MLIVIHHMTFQIQSSQICQNYFHVAGLMSTLVDFLNSPPTKQPCTEILMENPKERFF